MDEDRKRMIAIMASILTARRLSEFDPSMRFPATINAVHNAVGWAERILAEIEKDGQRHARQTQVGLKSEAE